MTAINSTEKPAKFERFNYKLLPFVKTKGDDVITFWYVPEDANTDGLGKILASQFFTFAKANSEAVGGGIGLLQAIVRDAIKDQLAAKTKKQKEAAKTSAYVLSDFLSAIEYRVSEDKGSYMSKVDVESAMRALKGMYRLFGGVRWVARELSPDHGISKETLRAIADRGQQKHDELSILMPELSRGIINPREALGAAVARLEE